MIPIWQPTRQAIVMIPSKLLPLVLLHPHRSHKLPINIRYRFISQVNSTKFFIVEIICIGGYENYVKSFAAYNCAYEYNKMASFHSTNFFRSYALCALADMSFFDDTQDNFHSDDRFLDMGPTYILHPIFKTWNFNEKRVYINSKWTTVTI